MKRTMLALTLVLSLHAAQDPPKAEPRVQKIFQIKHADVSRLAETFRLFAAVRVDSQLRVLAVDGSVSAVAAIEEAIKRLDVPSSAEKNLELTFHVLMAGQQAPAENTAVPADLEGVLRNLRALFPYKHYGLSETVFVRVRPDMRADTSGNIAPFRSQPDMPKVMYSLHCMPHLQPGEKPVVRLEELKFHMRYPYKSGGGYQFNDISISTQIDVREGQKVVVGKAAIDGGEGAIILVVTAKVVD